MCKVILLIRSGIGLKTPSIQGREKGRPAAKEILHSKLNSENSPDMVNCNLKCRVLQQAWVTKSGKMKLCLKKGRRYRPDSKRKLGRRRAESLQKEAILTGRVKRRYHHMAEGR